MFLNCWLFANNFLRGVNSKLDVIA